MSTPSPSDAPAKAHRFTVWGVALMTAAAVLSLRGLPMMAQEGLTMWFYIGFATLFFLIPGAFVSAELGGMFTRDKGGVYTWVKEAFGSSWGLAAVWLQWIQNVVWYPVALGFTAGALAYVAGRPDLASSPFFNFAVVVVVYWLATLIAMFGEKSYGSFSQWLFVLGTVLPGLFLMVLAVVWIALGNPIELISASAVVTDATSSAGHQVHPWLPQISGLGSIAFLAGTVLLFAGVEVQGVRAGQMKRPSREFPEAMILAAIIVFVIFTFGSLAIATMFPVKELSLTAGIMQAYKAALDKFHLGWMVPVIAAFLAAGALGQIVTWIGGPSRALLQTAENGEIPPHFAVTNRSGAPRMILLLQALIVTVLGSFYLIFPNPSAAFYLLSAMTVSLYLLMYLMMYAAAIRLRYTAPDAERHFRVPGGSLGMWLIAGFGFLAVAFALVVSFFPPSQVPVGSPMLYTGLVIAGLVVFGAAPFLIHAAKKPEWVQPAASPEAAG
ncbi:APC family permease [Frigidibacter sp. ROC022]|uniref:APC family permease n=1 Tax=Frigidibacter sp. ROC022 TaxID=2971796 RepID=UPI00215AF5B2|nr:APC family permease [Frigidibacter sp. ROC022]MCR8722699.1 APC family permease [Frigidibacter sp. ROC022]